MSALRATAAVLALFSAGPLLLAAKTPPVDQQLLDLTNDARAAAGCPPLRLNADLSEAAAGHSADMAHRNFYDHTGSNGSDPAGRTRAAGYPGDYIGENIAAGYPSIEVVFRKWMDTTAHRDNILNCKFTDLGIGHANVPGSRYGDYWTQNLGRPPGG
ncbi:CAP domain-containing protein [Saccharopolyspora hirsuta]|uniref:CAP domain-containing protein n=1 Tax=Saccharopolyspora hirsuta TaxID=1837 RepID=A0A5M7C432_SACHI|nr:CAP domain-containing protein [Saccharopolyspora hirsuta]KAA5837146.1 CAP domain-containing protein [Saccharopolyspora hirsuta]